jgi:hypothetical protein
MAFKTNNTTSDDCGCGCDGCCKDCGCDCCGDCCDPAPTQIPATAPGKVVVRTGEDLRLSRGVNQVDSIAATPILLTLPQAGIVGDEVLVNACDANVKVEGGALDIMGQDPTTGVLAIAGGGSALFTLTSCCDPTDPNKKHEWAVLLGQERSGCCKIGVKNISLPEATPVYTLTFSDLRNPSHPEARFEILRFLDGANNPSVRVVLPAPPTSDDSYSLIIENRSQLDLTFANHPTLNEVVDLRRFQQVELSLEDEITEGAVDTWTYRTTLFVDTLGVFRVPGFTGPSP